MALKKCDVATLNRFLDYDRATGIFRWKESPGKSIAAGDVAGCAHVKGYISIRLNGCKYFAHRIAWAIEYGEFPDMCIDHINGIRSDNRLSNLRVALPHENSRNTRKKNGQNKFKGVAKHCRPGKYRARIMVGGKRLSLGVFKSEDDAARAYDEAAVKYYGEFARLNFQGETRP